jgi:Na+/H+ antiporter NhaD/arsenite permease-like protein
VFISIPASMTTLIIILFILGYAAIAFEHPLKLNKAASALITGVLCWTVYVLQADSAHTAQEALLVHIGDISSILFFLLGAMTVVELIDMYSGFDFITQRIKTKKKSTLLLLITGITFFLSALLDNLTTAIVMTSLCSKLLSDKEDRLWFAGMIVIAANAGGAWSPLGDVTTTMLWIGGQITALSIIKQLILPSIAVCLVPALILAYRFKGKTIPEKQVQECTAEENRDGRIILFTGIGLLLFVPAFKSLTGLPPFMGMLLALGLMWIVTTRLNKQKETGLAEKLTVSKALEKIDTSSILFFLGILLAVSALQSAGVLTQLAGVLNRQLHNDYAIGITLGLLSSIVDNVPLVAASQGMYDLSTYPTDHVFWEFLALTTGTGGSAIIIGSAAGVAVMGIEQIGFGWYLKRISWLALAGFTAGVIVFIIKHQFLS